MHGRGKEMDVGKKDGAKRARKRRELCEPRKNNLRWRKGERGEQERNGRRRETDTAYVEEKDGGRRREGATSVHQRRAEYDGGEKIAR